MLAQRLPLHCHGPLHFGCPVLSAPNIPPNSVAKHGSGKKGTEGLGSVGTEAMPYNTRNFAPPYANSLSDSSASD